MCALVTGVQTCALPICTCTTRRSTRRPQSSTAMPLLWRHHDHHRGFRAPLPPACAALSGTVIRDTGAVTRHGLSPTPSRADPRLEADPLALALLKSRRHTTKIGPSAFARPLLRSKFRRSDLRYVRFWAATSSTMTCAKQLSP